MEENPLILANGHVVTCDAADRAGRLHLVIRDGRIQEIGGILDVLAAMYPSATIIDVSGKLIVPGFVNAHYHTGSFLLRELTAGKPFRTWKEDRRIRDLARALLDPANSGNLVTVATASYLAHLKSGTTCLGEFPPPVDLRGLDLLFRANDSTGLRTVVMLQNWDQIACAREETGGRRGFFVGLGREEDFTVYSFENFVRASKEFGWPLAAHVGEQRENVEFVRKKFLKRHAALLRDFGALQPSTALMHLNHGAAEDAGLLADAGASVVLCAASAAIKQCGYPFLRAIVDKSPRVCVGTDWGNVNMLVELRFLKSLPFLFEGMPAFSALDLLRMATIEGAQALGVADTMGSIEAGKQADLQIYRLDDIRFNPSDEQWTAGDYAEVLLESGFSNSVTDVLVGGRFVLRGKELVSSDEAEACENFRRTRGTLLAAVNGRRIHSGGETAQRKSASKTKPTPFAGGERAEESGSEDFVEGFSIVPKSEEPAPVQHSLTVPPVTRAASVAQPELTKDVKKVFGEDDDV